MKAIILFACALIVGNASAATGRYHLNQKLVHRQPRLNIQELIDDFIASIIASAKAVDPVQINDVNVALLWWAASLQSFQVEGFSNLDVQTTISIFPPKVDLSVTMPKVSGSVGSWASNFPIISGNGDASFEVNSVSAKINIGAGITGLKSTVDISVGSADVSITGVQNDAALSQEISDKINFILNDLLNSPWVDRVLESIINSILGGLPIA